MSLVSIWLSRSLFRTQSFKDGAFCKIVYGFCLKYEYFAADTSVLKRGHVKVSVLCDIINYRQCVKLWFKRFGTGKKLLQSLTFFNVDIITPLLVQTIEADKFLLAQKLVTNIGMKELKLLIDKHTLI